jgi:hypothetical protein
LPVAFAPAAIKNFGRSLAHFEETTMLRQLSIVCIALFALPSWGLAQTVVYTYMPAVVEAGTVVPATSNVVSYYAPYETSEVVTWKPVATAAPVTTYTPVTSYAPVTAYAPTSTVAPVVTYSPITTTQRVVTYSPVTTTTPVIRRRRRIRRTCR